MSTDFRPLKHIAATDMFDGRLEAFGVREHFNVDTTDTSRMLTDGRNYLWVYVRDDLVAAFTRYAPNGSPGKILSAIAEAFDVDIVSEYEPQFWGFDTEEEWQAAEAAIAKEYDEQFFAEILKYLKGEPHDIRPGSVGMQTAEHAKKLVEEDPTLLLPANKSKFRDAIETYNLIITLSPEDLSSAEMIATHEDDLPKA